MRTYTAYLRLGCTPLQSVVLWRQRWAIVVCMCYELKMCMLFLQ